MLSQAVLAGVELGLNRVLRLDATALPRLASLNGAVIEIDCQKPPVQLFLLPSEQGVQLAGHWDAPADCRLRAPAASLLRLALSKDKSSVLHSPEIELQGDSAVLLDLAAVLQDLELDWEYELSRWLGPLGAQVLASHLKLRARWLDHGLDSLRLSLADFLSEESRSLVGTAEAEARFAELDSLKVALERLEARVARLSLPPEPSDPA
ncbi:SCP2 sterol-binding domain-containing protein [Pseudomonas sp. LS44]|uniref:ubiquinone biosynthesis accessory factor UbiJ n=1 Tax=Pseudomonas sp. LS44 TaxID=1357074 RepID=UPI00215A0D91|nr:SCP2 sterol-binding domain-containing protein [Pseudomonas sp. LS44]UVE18240.1 SCP2 sterol-binding domain-containing protein [Pseudomonas sp. LS44]